MLKQKTIYILYSSIFLSLIGCSDFSGMPLYSNNSDANQRQNLKQNDVPANIACYAKKIKIMPVKYYNTTKQNYPAFNNFVQNLNYELTDTLSIIKNNAHNCSYSKKNNEDDAIYRIYIRYETQAKIAEIGRETYACSSQITFKIHYSIKNKDEKIIVNRDIVTNASTIRPKSGFAYGLDLEDIDNSISSFIARTILLQILNDLSLFLQNKNQDIQR